MGYQHGCVLNAAGLASCRGWIGTGALGADTVPRCCGGYIGGPAFRDRLERPVRVANGARFVAISAGSLHTCAIGVDHLAYCWGVNVSGQLGVGSVDANQSADRRGRPYPSRVIDIIHVTSISAGLEHTCGVANHGKVYCWGRNVRGALGVPGVATTGRPVLIQHP